MTDETPEEKARLERAERLARAMRRSRNIMEAADMAADPKKIPRHPVVASGAFGDIHAVRPRYQSETGLPAHIVTHSRYALSPEAAFATHCIERWGMIMGEADGEDSAGRQKGRRMTADEVVGHACDCAEKAFAEFHKRGWITMIPTMAELADLLKDAENSND